MNAEKEPTQGRGQGSGNAAQGQGGFKYCVCPKCGNTEDKTRGTPCQTKSCSKCGTKMVGSNTRGKVSTKDVADSVIEACDFVQEKIRRD